MQTSKLLELQNKALELTLKKTDSIDLSNSVVAIIVLTQMLNDAIFENLKLQHHENEIKADFTRQIVQKDNALHESIERSKTAQAVLIDSYTAKLNEAKATLITEEKLKQEKVRIDETKLPVITEKKIKPEKVSIDCAKVMQENTRLLRQNREQSLTIDRLNNEKKL